MSVYFKWSAKYLAFSFSEYLTLTSVNSSPALKNLEEFMDPSVGIGLDANTKNLRFSISKN